MIRTALVISALIAANLTVAATPADQAAIMDNEPVITLGAPGKSWTVISMESSRGVSKVRKFFDMGTVGIQQIDYVVNCADKSVALAGFSVLKTTESVPSGPMAVTSYDDLVFYKPKLDIDRNVANTACDKRLAMSESVPAN